MKSLRGFTLLELIVVIAVVAFLVALLVPAAIKVRESGNRAACVSNLRQIGTAFNFYVQDKGSYPRVYGGWYPLLLPYLGVDTSQDISITQPQVLRCPSNRNHEWNRQKLSYGYNPFLGNTFSSGGPGAISLRPGMFTHPAKVILCGDVDSRLDNSNATIGYNTAGTPPGVVHHGGANLCFVDAHVEWKKPEEITASPGRYTADILKIWGMYGQY